MSYIDYLVTALGLLERASFYDYLHTLGYTDDKSFDRESMINSTYPPKEISRETNLILFI